MAYSTFTNRFAFVLASLVFMVTHHSFAAHSQDLKVISNVNSSLQTLTRNEIRQIYMGGTLSRKYSAVSLPVGSDTRNTFNNTVIGLTENRIQSYWDQLLFTGRSTPPKEMQSVDDVLAYLEKNPDSIAYVPSNMDIPDTYVVVYEK
ncbi:hypothetical protein [Marinomonas sp. IMCC 4694]|uniref:hypothetical protein n=1 Tax=Marinomonas sp. IMCC 4694 TaxID=2605432 RepID=UPI0011E6A07B|nr:hypothetical protein [Marinomonas sp. IMCC 4694]TYL47583.1 hypothetical protein FXV75_06240 [Marinomonas sp. IMCC 4694]